MINTKNFDTKKITVAVLAVVAIILLALIYKQEMPATQNSNSNSNSGSPSQASPQAALVPDFSNEDGTLDVEKQKAYLFGISISSSDEEKAAHYQYATSIAESAEYLDLTSCANVYPLVLEMSDGDEITLKNDSDKDVTLALDEVTAYVVKAKSTELISPTFGRSVGLYGYGCQDSTGARGAGMILVKP